MTTTPCCHCNVSLVCSPCPRAFTTLRAGQIEINIHFCIHKHLIFILFPEKTLSFHFKCLLWRIPFNISKIQSWTKMLRKMHVVSVIWKYFPLTPGSLKILTPPPPKNNVEVWPEHFCRLLNNIDQGGVGGGVTMVPNSQVGLLCVGKSKILNTFCPRLYLIPFGG